MRSPYRHGDDVLAGLPELSIHGLGDSDARALLLDNVYGPLDAAVCDQIVSESHGNPLALLELPRTWRARDLAGGFGLPGSQLVARRSSKATSGVFANFPRYATVRARRGAEPIGDRCCSTVLRRRSASTWLRLAGGGRRAAPRW